MSKVLMVSLAISASMLPAASTAQDVVMRRPLPHGSMASPGDPTPPTGLTPTSAIPDPSEEVCDRAPGSAAVKLTSVQWVEDGWTAGGMSAQSCSVQKMSYLCQATYACDVGGQSSSFVSVAPDSVCEGFKGEVAYPGDTPDPTSFPSDRSLDDQVKWFMAKADAAVMRQQSGGAPVTGSEVIRSIPWVRGVDQVTWWIPSEYGNQRHTSYVRVFLDPGGGGLYDAGSAICSKMRESGHPCTNYYAHEGGSTFVAYIL